MRFVAVFTTLYIATAASAFSPNGLTREFMKSESICTKALSCTSYV